VEFSIGMGPRIATIHGKLTDYSLKAFPFGGSCAMKGELETEDEADDTADEPDGTVDEPEGGRNETADGSAAKRKASLDPDDFNSKKAWQRFIIIAAGPCFNFILAFICACVMVAFTGISKPVLDSVIDGYPAQEAGMQAGDVIISINGHKTRIYEEVRLYISMHSDEVMEVEFLRDGKEMNCTITPKFDEETGSYLMGVRGYSVTDYPKNILEAAQYGYYLVRYNIYMCIESIKYMVGGHATLNDVMGPVGMVEVIGDTVDESYQYGATVVMLTILNFIILFSANLGVMNLLPIPALDGGRLIFIIYELVTGREVNKKLEAYVAMAGFAVLMGLMLIIMVHDIGRIGSL
jgi:regulator of sigma E protease